MNLWNSSGGTVYPVQSNKKSTDERLELHLTASLMQRINAEADKKISRVYPGGNVEGNTKSSPSKARKTASSFYSSNSKPICVHELSSCRGYKVLTFVTDESGYRSVYDLSTGLEYQTGNKSKITRKAVLFDTESAAASEKFRPQNISIAGVQTSTTRLPRILCAFDGWGEVKRRHGVSGSSEYEYVKFVKVVKFLDPISPHAKAKVDIKKTPNFFGEPDHSPPPRDCSPRFLKTHDRPLMGK